jgi:cell wall assembly regulator SMI1
MMTLAKKLEAIDALLAEVRPATAKAMRPGASDAALAALAKAIGAAVLPDDVAAFFRWHDGQATPRSLREDDNRTPMSVDDALDAWSFLSDPTEDVLQPWKKTWLPVLENGAGDHLCFDLADGSLVAYWHAEEDRRVEHASLAAWADDVIASLTKEADAAAKKVP